MSTMTWRVTPKSNRLVSLNKEANSDYMSQKHNNYISHELETDEKWLEQQGVTFQEGKGSHLKVFLSEKQSTLPMHGMDELSKGLEAAIKRQLGLK